MTAQPKIYGPSELSTTSVDQAEEESGRPVVRVGRGGLLLADSFQNVPKHLTRPIPLYVGRCPHYGQAAHGRMERTASICPVVPTRGAMVDWRSAQFGGGPLWRDIFTDVRGSNFYRATQPLRVGCTTSPYRQSSSRSLLVGPRGGGTAPSRPAKADVARGGAAWLE